MRESGSALIEKMGNCCVPAAVDFGCSCCCQMIIEFEPDNTIEGQGDHVYDVARKLHLNNQEINGMFSRFDNYDNDHSGLVSLQEFVNSFQISCKVRTGTSCRR